MNCPKCGSNILSVRKTRHNQSNIIRYRQCNKCEYRFKTEESIMDGWTKDYYKNNLKKLHQEIRSLVNQTEVK